MKYSTYRFTLDLQKHQSQISIAVFQYDTAVRLYISLTDGGIPYHIADGCRAVFYGKRPDGADLVHNCMIEGNTRIIYDFNDQTAYCEGTVDAQICLYGIDGDIITAPRLLIVASARTVNPTDIDLSDKPLSALDQIFASETKRETAELERVEAEEDRVQAEAERVEAEAERVEAEKQRGREAQKWVTGSYVDENGDTQNVTSEDPQFENNAVYYAGKAAESAESAKNYAEVIAPQEAEEAATEAATEAANNVLGTVNNRLSANESNIAAADVRIDKAEDRLDNVDYILEQFGAVKAQVDSSAALVKSIPARSDLFAYLNSVGGKTEKYNQLLNLPEGAGTGYYFWQLAEGSSFGQQLNEKITTIINGVTIVNNGDGSFTINGTAENYSTFALFSIYLLSSEDYAEKYSFSIPVPNGNHYLSFGGASLPAGAYVYVGTDWGVDEGGWGGEISATGGALSIYSGWHICVMDLNFEAGTVFNNLTIKPMLNLGTSALPWQSPADPFTGLRSGKVTDLKVYGTNLFDPSICLNNNFIDNGDGTYTMKRNGDNRFSKWADFYIPAKKTFRVSGKLVQAGAGNTCVYFRFADGTTGGSKPIDGTTSAFNFEQDIVAVCIYMQGVTSSTPSEAIVSNLMISYGNVPYYPYKEPTTYTIPEAVQNLPLYGEGVTDSSTKITYSNTANFENKQYSKPIVRRVLNGTEKWESNNAAGNLQYFATKIGEYGSVVKHAILSDKYTTTVLSVNNTNFGIGITNSDTYNDARIVVRPENVSSLTLADFINGLKENPLQVVYALSTPEVTDISAELEGFDPVIPVEGGGQIEFVNDYNYDVPSTITYNIIQEAAI